MVVLLVSPSNVRSRRLKVGWRRVWRGLRLAFTIVELLFWTFYLASILIFRLYIPLKIHRWWNVRKFRRRLTAEGVPEDVASRIANTQFPDILGSLSLRRLLFGRRKKRR